MGEIRVDLRTRIIQNDHKVFVARPGESSRLYGTFLAAQAIGPELPGLDLKRGVTFAEQPNLDARIKRSLKLRSWHRSGAERGDEPDRRIGDYEDKSEPRGMAQHRGTVRAYFDAAARGDLAIIIPNAWNLDALIGEFLDGPESVVSIPVPEFYRGDPLSGRRIKILARVPKRQLPGHVIDIHEKPSAIVLLDKSTRPLVYRAAYGGFVLGSDFSAEFNVTSRDYRSDTDLFFSTFFNFVAANTVSVAFKKTGASIPMSAAVFAELGEYAPQLRTNVNSPGFLQYEAKNIIPIVAAVLFALAVTVGPDAVNAAQTDIIKIGNSAAPAGDICTAEVSNAVLDQLKLYDLDDWPKACDLARKAQEKAGMQGTVTVQKKP